jgi:hypothetical protein
LDSTGLSKKANSNMITIYNDNPQVDFTLGAFNGASLTLGAQGSTHADHFILKNSSGNVLRGHNDSLTWNNDEILTDNKNTYEKISQSINKRLAHVINANSI